MNGKLFLGLMFLVGVYLGPVPRGARAADEQSARKPDVSAGSSAKSAALKWVDRFRKVQVLFSDEDVQRLRAELADGTDEKAKTWLSETKEIRDALDSRRWNETRKWLREFLRVQAIYSDEDIARFRAKAKKTAQDSAKNSSVEFVDFLKDIEHKRKRFAARATGAEQIREQQLALAAAYHKKQDTQRAAVQRAAARRAATIGTSGQSKTVKRRRYRRAPVLVDSLDVARWEIRRNLYRRW